MSTQKEIPNALIFADDRPTSCNDDLYQWAVDAEDLIRAQLGLIQTMKDALEAYKPFIPTVSAKDGGAAKHSANVRAADQFRDALAAAEAHK